MENHLWINLTYPADKKEKKEESPSDEKEQV